MRTIDTDAELREPAPEVSDRVRETTASLWAALSALRGKRIFHPDGDAYLATFTVPDRPGKTGAALFDEPGPKRAIVRASRAAGLPEPLPDALGLAVRLQDAHGLGHHQDFLLITSANLPVAHHLIVPAVGGFFGHSYSSLLPYRIGGALRLVGAVPVGHGRRARTLTALAEAARAGDARFDLSLAAVGGRFRPVGRVQLSERLSPEASEALRFNPWHTGGGITPVGPLQTLRGAAYRGSQAGRRAR